jgi:MFS family permease
VTSPARLGPQVRAAWAETGTRLGLWTHFGTQFPAATFMVMWGYPFLVIGQGLTPAAAGTMLTVVTAAFMFSGPILGVLVGRYPLRRSRMALAIVGVTAGCWTVVLLWPGRAPLWMLIVLAVVLGVKYPLWALGAAQIIRYRRRARRRYANRPGLASP